MHIKQIKIIKIPLLIVLFAVMLSIQPNNANAGVFDVVSNLFTNKDVISEDKENEYTSQNIPLLKAPVNYNTNKAVGGGDIVVNNDATVVAESGPAGGVTQFIDDSNNGRVSLYIVREGDNLSEIASAFDVSINTIRWANDLSKNSNIKIGQELVILPITGIRYVIKRGGTLRDVVKKYGGDLGDTVKYNGFGADEELKKGTVVIIPNGTLKNNTSYIKKKQRYHSSKNKRIHVTSKARHVATNYIPGYFVHPLNHKGVRTQKLHGYNAVDFGARVGTPIIASASGKVIVAKRTGYNGGYGRYTMIQHPNGTQTLYAHMSKNISYVGQKVVQGQIIGYVGNTGRSTGPHLHFEIRGAKNIFAY